MIDVELDIGLEWGSSGFGQSEVEKAIDAAVKFAAIPELADPPVPVSVSIKLSDNDEVHALNKEWREKDKATNVLSFPSGTPKSAALGDVLLFFGSEREGEADGLWRSDGSADGTQHVARDIRCFSADRARRIARSA